VKGTQLTTLLKAGRGEGWGAAGGGGGAVVEGVGAGAAPEPAAAPEAPLAGVRLGARFTAVPGPAGACASAKPAANPTSNNSRVLIMLIML
jgi:hypothetical protein